MAEQRQQDQNSDYAPHHIDILDQQYTGLNDHLPSPGYKEPGMSMEQKEEQQAILEHYNK